MKRPALRIAAVVDPVARTTGLRPGDAILRVNGEDVHDALDFRFHASGDRITLEVAPAAGGGRRRVRMTGDACGQLSFAPLKTRRCRNRCLFCFVDQLPRGLRRTLYVKDEDVRFSFLFGNYVTLSSVTEEELQRVRRMRMSPLYVSVHATDPAVRNTLLGRRGSRDILETLERLAGWGITVHAQVVLCPGINDGKVLDRTLRDLVLLRPALASVAVVPVGLTRHRRANGLAPLRGVSRRDAARLIRQADALKGQRAFAHPGPFLMLADEIYRKAGVGFPPLEEYGDLPQLENGVGMIARFLDQCRERSRQPRRGVTGHRVPGPGWVATGELAAPHVVPYLRDVERRTGARLRAVVVKNRFLGRQVNVTGLLTGRDLIGQLREQGVRRGMLFIPDVMLDHQNGRFLDDISPEELGRALGMPVWSFPAEPEGFERVLLHRCRIRKKIKKN